MTDENFPSTSPLLSRRMNGLKIAALVVISALAGAVASRAAQHWHHRGPGFMSGQMDPAEVERHAERMADHLAKEVNATEDQRGKIETIAKAAAKDMLPMRDSMREARKQARELLSQPVIDKAAVETLRADQIAKADALSKRLSDALTQASEVLTPEQRKQLAARMAKHDSWRG